MSHFAIWAEFTISLQTFDWPLTHSLNRLTSDGL